MFYRKVIAASLSGSIFAILFGLFVPYPNSPTSNLIWQYISSVLISIPVYLMYSFPFILIYGGITSLLSEIISRRMTKNQKAEFVVLGALHLAFGSVFFLIFNPYAGTLSLAAAFLFFVTDRYLQNKRASYRLTQALMSLEIPIGVWILFMGLVYLQSMLTGF
ncbi:hypothetical protein [Exiguobacterium undae]|uniref:DUF3429 domain-containing protein n=1 Tax=Exiguobacterium undae TaxID=169177 RepID=A0ABX2VCN9_9BACL|nr:hypothetical protein [Exiguobacterium undae]OAN15466.1 hypothetical protein A3783_05905 [Exiguobacterium undae]